jgi:hypothetical protein
MSQGCVTLIVNNQERYPRGGHVSGGVRGTGLRSRFAPRALTAGRSADISRSRVGFDPVARECVARHGDWSTSSTPAGRWQ